MKKPFMLMILDGFGLKESENGNAIKAASKLRREGKKVELVFKREDKNVEEYEAYAKNNRVYEIDKRYI